MFFTRKLLLFIFILHVFFACFLFFSFNSFADDVSKQDKVDARLVSIDFDHVDIKVVIKFISKLTGKNFIIDNKVKGKVTIVSPTKIPVKDVYKVFESVLAINGFSTVTSGKIIKIIPTPQAKGENIDTKLVSKPSGSLTLNDNLVTRIIPLEYANADEVKTVFTPLIHKGSVIISYRDTNMLIVTSTLSSINRILKIINVIDVPGIGKTISVIPIIHAEAGKLIKNISSIFAARTKETKGKKSAELFVKFTSDERTNSIVLLASKHETENIKRLINMLDQEVPKGEERIRVYYLEHASAENLVKVLQKIPSAVTKKQTGKHTEPILSDKIKIMADKETNSLIIMADKEDYPILEDVIKKLDIPRAMVYIECLIMEVNAERDLNIGTKWTAASEVGDSRGALGGFNDQDLNPLTLALPQNLLTGFSVGVIGKLFKIGDQTFPDIRAVINAYKSDKDVNILSTPQILTMENEEATIIVGQNIPFQTRSAAESASETYSSYEYKDVGITLKITPQISKDRLVKLKVSQKITKLDNASNTDTNDRPSTLKREIDTTIIVEDSNSIVIGGLIDETSSMTEIKTPCLGDIPLLGLLFKTVSKGGDRKNLYVFLTPRVIKNPLEADKIYQEKIKHIEGIQQKNIDIKF